MKSRGFTLIETLVTLVILAVLTVSIVRSIRQSFIARAKLQAQIDAIAPVRDTLRFMERDIQMAYHYLDLQKELADALHKTQKQKKNPSNTAPANPYDSPNNGGYNQGPNGPANPFLNTQNRMDPTTHFIAKESEIHFVTMNTTRLFKNSPQADFGEVSYFIDECKNRPDKKFNNGKCLFRRFSPIVDADVTEGGTKTQLLFDVTEFKVKMFSSVQKDWRKDWNSTARGGDINTKDRYPEAVEITLTTESSPKENTESEKKKVISLQSVISIHNPNNKELNANAPSAPANPSN